MGRSRSFGGLTVSSLLVQFCPHFQVQNMGWIHSLVSVLEHLFLSTPSRILGNYEHHLVGKDQVPLAVFHWCLRRVHISFNFWARGRFRCTYGFNNPCWTSSNSLKKWLIFSDSNISQYVPFFRCGVIALVTLLSGWVTKKNAHDSSEIKFVSILAMHMNKHRPSQDPWNNPIWGLEIGIEVV